jgi:D-serine deaminase-like pyridoxal phosphate-dependent protein
MMISELTTPCLLLDRRVMRSNIRRMQRHIFTAGTTLRPHVKTSKSLEIAEEMTREYPRAITVSTLREAAYFADNGFTDILYSVAPPPAKLPQIGSLLARGLQVTVLADNEASVAAIVEYGRHAEIHIPVLLEIDCDGHRSGLRPDPAVVAPLARNLTGAESAIFRGIMTHAGGAYASESVAAISNAAVNERDVMVNMAAQLASAGLRCEVVSVGSTPTALFGNNFQGVTEVRAGVFVFNDLTMVSLGVCGLQDIAISVLTTVIGHRRVAAQIVTDSGWMALSCDLSTQGRPTDYRYGLVCDGLTGEPMDDLIVAETNQEHGLIGRRTGGLLDFSKFPVGRLLRILPVHACATAAAHASYQVTEGPSNVIGEWRRCGGW